MMLDNSDDDFDSVSYTDAYNCKCSVCGEPHFCQTDCMNHRKEINFCMCIGCYNSMFQGRDGCIDRKTDSYKLFKSGSREQIDRYLTFIALQK